MDTEPCPIVSTTGQPCSLTRPHYPTAHQWSSGCPAENQDVPACGRFPGNPEWHHVEGCPSWTPEPTEPPQRSNGNGNRRQAFKDSTDAVEAIRRSQEWFLREGIDTLTLTDRQIGVCLFLYDKMESAGVTEVGISRDQELADYIGTHPWSAWRVLDQMFTTDESKDRPPKKPGLPFKRVTRPRLNVNRAEAARQRAKGGRPRYWYRLKDR